MIKSYTFVSIVTQLFTLVAGVVTRRLLGPLDMGIWSMLQLVLSYGGYSSLGVIKATHREIGLGNDVKDLCFSFGLLTSVVVGLIVSGFGGVFVFAGAYLVLSRVNNMLISFTRAYQRFDIASSQMLLSAILNAVLIVVLAYNYRLYGFFGAMVLTLVFNIVYIWFRLKFKCCIRLRGTRHLVRLGVPFLVLGLLNTCMLTVDRLIVLWFMGLESLGIYSIALLGRSLVLHVPNAASVVFLPKMFRIKNPKDYAVVMAVKMLFVGSFIVLVSWFAMPVAIELLLPQYVEGIGAMRVFMLMALVMGVDIPLTGVFVTLKRQKELYLVSGVSVLLGGAFSYAGVNYGLTGVALGVLVAQVFKTVSISIMLREIK